MYFQCFKGIFGTAGMIPAGFGKSRRNDPLVDLNGNGQQGNQQPTDPFDKEEIINTFRKT
jgi:hypothetical protein